MGLDVCSLVRRDHDDLDAALAAMVNPATTPNELANLLDVFRLALAVHTATETKIFDQLLHLVKGPPTLAMIATHSRIEHVAQRITAEQLSSVRPGSIAWYEGALELRIAVLDHAARADQTRWTLQDHVSPEVQRMLAREYATERMRVLASTSPALEAQRRVNRAYLS